MTEATASQHDDSERARLGAALRELLDVVVRADAPDDVLAAATAQVDELRARLAALGQAAEQMLDFSAIRREMSLVGGRAHPVGPQIEFAATEHGSVGRTTIGPVFEGGPGLVHGGILALLLDHAMGHAAVTAGYAAMTTELTLRFRRPTRLGRPLQVSARLDRKAGRMLHLAGEIAIDGTTSVEAHGVFVTLTGANVASIFGDGRS
jgi:acyl-coenzyme A thioesterase PaaI-like protein